jgi:alanine-glyoxylate transaminase/serine-glyoxylate transaminase/serine-pyruvate transaminase
MLVADPANRLWSLNTPRVPEGIQDVKVRARLVAETGIDILGGFGPLAGRIFRVGLMGASSIEENVLAVLEGLEAALRAEGYQPAASGHAAAERFYAANPA